MTRIVTRGLKEDKDGIQGYIAYPEREERGPSILMIHQHSGLTGYLKTAAYNFAQLGYTAVVPNLYHMLGYPAEQHIDKGTEIQNKTPDPDFVRVIDRGWRYCLSRNDVDGTRVGVIGYCMGGRHRHSLRRCDSRSARVCRLLPVGSRRTADQDSTAPSVSGSPRNQMPVDGALWWPGRDQYVPDPTKSHGKFPRQRPTSGVALLSLRQPRLRFDGVRRLSALSSRSNVAAGHGVLASRVGWTCAVARDKLKTRSRSG